MTGNSHVAFGMGAALTASFMLEGGLNSFTVAVPLIFIGSLLPDIDSYNSKLKRNMLIKLLTLPLTMFGHRTWSHSLLVLAIVSLPILFLEDLYREIAILFSIAYASHLLGDYLTVSGIPLTYPSKKRYRSPKPFKTGSFIEYPVALIPGAIGIALYFSS